MKNIKSMIMEELEKNQGILRFTPTWVPRSFLMPGRRLKLHPADLYALGAHRGGIDERWFASTTHADNGPGTPEDEGLSYFALGYETGAPKVLFRDAVQELGDELLGKAVMRKYGGWKMFSKFFDNSGPIPHHVHLMDRHAANVNKAGKAEAYYFPVQLNYARNNFPYTFFGLEPGTRKEDVMECLKNWNRGDNGMLQLTRAYELMPGTGWDVPPGVLHAPGSLLTYEPQQASDVYSMFQSLVEGRPVARELLVKDIPGDKSFDFEYLVDILDWDLNVDPNFMANRRRLPVPVKGEAEMREAGYVENWIVYGNDAFSAKELTVLPGRTVKIADAAAYGFIMMQGHGRVNGRAVETPAVIRYGQLTDDEMFVTGEAAKAGVTIRNDSACDSIVMLKHFGPGNPDARPLIKES